jgi:hypothetical protein
MIIGLVGFKQVGKSTAAKHLEENHRFIRHNMKDALVAEMKENLWEHMLEIGCAEADRKNFLIAEDDTEETIIARLFEEKPPLFRTLMQNYGTDVRRKEDDNYWVVQWVEACFKKPRIVVDDVRFLNEAKAVTDMNGIIIRLTRPDIGTGGTHKSETEQLKITAHHTIECEPGDHITLYRELDKIISQMK